MKPNRAVGRNEFRMGDSQNGKCEREGREERERESYVQRCEGKQAGHEGVKLNSGAVRLNREKKRGIRQR